MQEHLLPEEYVQTMRRTMLDQCPVSPYSEVSQMIAKELGSPPEALFASFEELPIASASLAQVSHLCSKSSRLEDVKHSLSKEWMLLEAPTHVQRHSASLMQSKLSGCRSTELLGMMAGSLQ